MAILQKLSKQYELKTEVTVQDIFCLVRSKAAAQDKENAVIPFNPINYRQLRINANRITVERWPMNPAGAIGTIFFDVEHAEGLTSVRCTLSPYHHGHFILTVVPNLIVVIPGLLFFIFLFFFAFFIGLIGNFSFFLLLFLTSFLILPLSMYLKFRYNMGQLEIYSEMILRDLGILKKGERMPKIHYM